MIDNQIRLAYEAVRDRGQIVKPTRWQSMDVSKLPEATTFEILNHTLRAQITAESLDQLRAQVAPNLPWADDHFLERVGGNPLNPGEEWAHWPWANKANSFRSERVWQAPWNPRWSGDPPYDARNEATTQGFSHTYMERMWPKYAGQVETSHKALAGVRYEYGDAFDVVRHLVEAPDSRQAYLPIWFPEDTGKLKVRVPCSLGYHFIHRNGFLHCTYYIRSCDLYRHFRDDVYLTVRLQLWMLEQLRGWQSTDTVARGGVDWDTVRPGLFTMHTVSLHCFLNDFIKLWPDVAKRRVT